MPRSIVYQKINVSKRQKRSDLLPSGEDTHGSRLLLGQSGMRHKAEGVRGTGMSSLHSQGPRMQAHCRGPCPRAQMHY